MFNNLSQTYSLGLYDDIPGVVIYTKCHDTDRKVTFNVMRDYDTAYDLTSFKNDSNGYGYVREFYADGTALPLAQEISKSDINGNSVTITINNKMCGKGGLHKCELVFVICGTPPVFDVNGNITNAGDVHLLSTFPFSLYVEDIGVSYSVISEDQVKVDKIASILGSVQVYANFIDGYYDENGNWVLGATTKEKMRDAYENGGRYDTNGDGTNDAEVTVYQSRVGAEARRQAFEVGGKYVDANGATQTITAANSRQGKEAARVTAETARATAETGRASAETTRVNNENARKTAETARGTAETARASAETTRVNNENARKTAETARANAETARGTAETARATAETARASAETTRISNENTRKTAETARGTAETARASAETTRISNENTRKTAETARDTAEKERIRLEQMRDAFENGGTYKDANGVTKTVAVKDSRVGAEAARKAAYDEFMEDSTSEFEDFMTDSTSEVNDIMHDIGRRIVYASVPIELSKVKTDFSDMDFPYSYEIDIVECTATAYAAWTVQYATGIQFPYDTKLVTNSGKVTVSFSSMPLPGLSANLYLIIPQAVATIGPSSPDYNLSDADIDGMMDSIFNNSGGGGAEP